MDQPRTMQRVCRGSWGPPHALVRHGLVRQMSGLVTVLVASLVLLPAAALAQGQAWPVKPLRLVVPFAAGGSSDVMARTVARSLSDDLGQTLVVENRPGAGGSIALEFVARQAADGYTLLFGTIGTNGINPAVMRKLPYDPVRDFAPVSMLHTLSNVLIVHPSVGAGSVPELITLARARPGALTYASAGNGSSSHLAGELFKAAAGIDITHVPYKGGGAAMPDLLSGQVSMMFETIPTAMPPTRAGKVRALAVTTAIRSSIAPELPTMAEVGVRDFVVSSWTALFATGGTPRPVIERLNAAAVRLAQEPQYRARMREMGSDCVSSTPEELDQFVRAEISRYTRAAERAGVRND